MMTFIMLPHIRTQRHALGLSTVDLALAARVSQGRISYIERGIVEPTPDEAERIEAALDSLAQLQMYRICHATGPHKPEVVAS